jgi:hypothetical protein
MALNKPISQLPRWLAFRAQAALAWERSVKTLLAAIFGLGFALLLAFSGLLGAWGDPWRALLLGAALVLVLAGLAHFFWHLTVIPETERGARIAADSGTTLSRLRLFRTTLANDNPASAALFSAYRERAAGLIPRLRVRPPHARMARLDPMALRFALFGAVLLAAGLAGDERLERLAGALQPHWIRPLIAPEAVRVWQLPPDYLARPALEIDWRGDGDILLAEGTTLRVQVGDGRDLARIRVGGVGLTPQAENPLIGTSQVGVSGILTIGARRLHFEVIPDLPPNTDFINQPSVDDDRNVRFEYFAIDDHGIESLTLEVTAADDRRDHPLSELLRARPGRDARGEAKLDLTDHPLAGREVDLRLKASDGLGQSTISGAVRLRLPEALLVDPLARAIAHERLALTKADSPFAQGRAGIVNADIDRVRDSLGLMREAPELFEADDIIHLALAFVDRGLALSTSWTEVDAFQPVLWEAALRAEGGELASAERALREAERQLNRALALGESAQEIMRLTLRYEEAVARYMELLTAEAVLEGRVNSVPQGGPGGDVSEDQLAELMETLQELVETGNFDEARRLLAFITQLLRNMEVQLTTGSSEGDADEPSAFEEALDEIGELIAEQRRLQSETIQNRQNGSTSDTAREQAGLAERTGQLEPGAGDAGAPGDDSAEEIAQGGAALDEAARAMDDAARELERGNGFGAVTAQSEALEALREAATAFSAADQAARNRNERGRNSSISRDPLGRDMTGTSAADGDEVAIPEGGRRGEARAVLDALRDALSDQQLSDEERAYLRALLSQF